MACWRFCWMGFQNSGCKKAGSVWSWIFIRVCTTTLDCPMGLPQLWSFTRMSWIAYCKVFQMWGSIFVISWSSGCLLMSMIRMLSRCWASKIDQSCDSSFTNVLCQHQFPCFWHMTNAPVILLTTLVPVQKLCVDIYAYIYYSLYEFCYRSYIQRECHSVLAKLHPITFYREVCGPGLNATFCFLWFTNCVLLFDKNLTLGCLRLLVFVLNNILILGIWCSTIPHLPGCFCPWTFFENIRFNTVLTDSFMSHLTTQLGYSAGEFQALQLNVLVAFGVVD